MATIAEIFREKNVEFKTHGDHHHTSRGWINVDCPFCSPRSHRWRMGIRPDRPGTHCWSCGWHGTVETVRELTGCTDDEARRIVSEANADDGTMVESRLQSKRRHVRIPASVDDLRVPHKRYLRRRGFDPRVIEYRYGVRGIGLHARLAWRLFLPVLDSDGHMVTWTSRATVDNVRKKYIAASVEDSEIPIHDCLYGIELCGGSSVVIHEGPFDCWRTGPGSVALFGVDWTPSQIEQLIGYQNRFICLDNDELGRYRAKRLAEQLESFPGETSIVTIETGSDIADADESEIAFVKELVE